MFFWPMAANDPSAIEAIATKHHDLLPLRKDAGNAVSATRV
jgi:hypothetical protein